MGLGHLRRLMLAVAFLGPGRGGDHRRGRLRRRVGGATRYRRSALAINVAAAALPNLVAALLFPAVAATTAAFAFVLAGFATVAHRR